MIHQMITALKRTQDKDGHMELTREQAQYLLFVLYAIEEGDGVSVKFAIQDLLGVLPSEQEGDDGAA